MSWSDAEIKRVTAIEEMLNTVQVAISNLMSKQQMRQLLLVQQKEVQSLTTRIEALEAQLATLQSRLD